MGPVRRTVSAVVTLALVALLGIATAVPAHAADATLAGFSFTPTTVATQDAPGTITFTVRARSATPISQVLVVVRPRAAPAQDRFTFLTLAAGTATDGTWRGPLTLPVGSVPGPWNVGRVELENGTRTRYVTPDLRAAGFRTTFTVTGTADATAPGVVGLALSRAVVDTTSAPQFVTFRAHLTDGRAGVDRVAVPVVLPSGEPLSEPMRLVSGTRLDGIWSVEMPVPAGAQRGRLPLSLVAYDGVDNGLFLDSAALAAAGLPDGLTVRTGRPSAPTGVTAYQVGRNDVAVHWDTQPVAGPAVLRYQVKATCMGSLAMVVTTASPVTQVVLSLPSSRDACTFTATALNGGGQSDRSVDSDVVRMDRSPRPGLAALPVPRVLVPSSLGTGEAVGSVAVEVGFQGYTVAGEPGLCSYTLQRSTDAGPWQDVPAVLDGVTTDRLPSPQRRYQYRVRANSCAGTSTFWGYGPSFGDNLTQEDAPGRFAYSGGWSRVACAACSAGAKQVSVVPGATATFVSHLTTNLALVLSTGPRAGVMTVYVDGVVRGSVDAYSPVAGVRQVRFDQFSEGPAVHALQFVNSGPADRPVSIDAVVAV